LKYTRPLSSIRTAFLSAVVLCIGTVPWTQTRAASIVDGLERTVVLTGQSVPSLLGRSVSDVRLYRTRGGAWEPVPFQIDETDGTGSLEGTKNGIVDPADEIVFLAADAGDSASTDLWPDDAAAKAGPRVRLRLEDPARPGWRASVYAFLSPTLPLSGVRYVRYDAAQDLVETDVYQIGHGSSHGFQEILKILPSAGGDGVDFLDRQKLRLKIHIAQVNKDIVLREQMDQDVEMITGFSIRVRVRKQRAAAVQNAVVRLNRILVMGITAHGSFLGNDVGFEDSLSFRTVYEPAASWMRIGPIPVPDAEEFDPLAVRLSCDWNASASGMKLYNAANAGGVLINGKADSPEPSLSWPGTNGYLVTADPAGSPSAAVRHSAVVGVWELRGSPPGNTRSIYYKDDSSYESSDTGDKRSYGDFGIQVSQDPMHDTLDVRGTQIYFASGRTWPEADSVISAWIRPPSASPSEERRTVPLAVSVVPPGSGTVSVGPWGKAFADSVVTLTASPADGYAFSGWEGDLTGAGNPASLRMDGPKNVTARFVAVSRYTMTSDPAGLPCRVDGEAVTTPVTFDWIEGSLHSVSVDSLIPAGEGSRLHFLAWNGLYGPSVFFSVEPEDAVWTARFERQFALAAGAVPPDGGSIEGAPADPWIRSGTVLRLTALPAAGFAFLGWSGDVSGTGNPIALTMDRARSVVARFGNKPPVVAGPDLSFAEDGTLILTDPQIRNWAADENDPVSSLTFRFQPGPQLSADTVEAGIRIRSARPDWNGRDVLIVSAMDPSGGEGKDTLSVAVTPVPDPPSPFVLISPPAGAIIGEKPDSLVFSWQAASDPDGDAVTYVFRLDTSAAFSSPRLFVTRGLTAPDLLVVWEKDWGPGIYHWKVTAADATGRETECSAGFPIRMEFSAAPAACVLKQSYPNPFNAATAVEFGIPDPGRVKLEVFDLHGRRVRTLADGWFREGFVERIWNACDDKGNRVAAGIYVIRMTAGRFHASRKAVLVQ
jgi:hypothetical protein